MNRLSVPCNAEAKRLMGIIKDRVFAEEFTTKQKDVDDLWKAIIPMPRGSAEKGELIELALGLGDEVNEYRDETANYAAKLSEERPLDQWTENTIGNCHMVSNHASSGSVIEWLAARKEGFGGSDIGDLLGVTSGKYAKNPMDVVDEKATLDLDVYSVAQNMVTKDLDVVKGPLARGNAWESVIAHMYQDNMTPDEVKHLVTGGSDLLKVLEAKATFANPHRQWQVLNVDGLLCSDGKNPDGILEIKTGSSLKFFMPDGYKPEDGVFIVPPGYRAQVLNYLNATGFTYAVLVALIGDNRMLVFEIYADETVTGYANGFTFDEAVVMLDDLWMEVIARRKQRYGDNWEEYMAGMADRCQTLMDRLGGPHEVIRLHDEGTLDTKINAIDFGETAMNDWDEMNKMAGGPVHW